MYAKKRLQNYFDVVVVDAPCSGSGLFRKDPSAVEEWSENNVQLCAQRQQRILADIMPSLKEESVLIYSTCSYSQQEDEDIADWLVEEFKVQSLKLKVEENWNIIETISKKEKSYGYLFYPGKVKGEGFFIAAFRTKQQAPDSYREGDRQAKKRRSEKLSVKETEILKPYLDDSGSLFFIKQNEEIIALPVQLEHGLESIQSSLYIKKAGTKLGTLIRNELIPAHELAVSNIIDASVPRYEVDREVALQYLRKEEIKINTDVRGWLLLTHQQLPMGWVKIMSNRINNYYPAAWRILNK